MTNDFNEAFILLVSYNLLKLGSLRDFSVFLVNNLRCDYVHFGTVSGENWSLKLNSQSIDCGLSYINKLVLICALTSVILPSLWTGYVVNLVELTST